MNSILEERTINLRDLFAEIVQKLAIIILVAALCAVIFPTYKYVRDLKNTNIVTELTDEEKQQVETYLSKQSAYENMEEYVDKSDFMKLNPYNTVREIITYRVDGIDSTADVNGIVKVFKDWINGGGIEAIDNDLISCDNSITKKYVITENEVNVFTVTIWAAETSEIVEMKQNAESGIEEFAAKLQDTYNFNLTKTNEVKSNIYSTEVESRQQSVMTNLNTVKTELDSLYGSFTDSQKNAIKSDTDEKQQEVSVKFSIKYILAGMILAIICSIAIIIIIYAIKGKLISNDAIWEELNIINYGKVITKTKGGIFRNLADKIRKINKTDSIELIAAKIMLNVEAGNVLIFSGKVDDKLGKLFIDAIKKVADKNVHVKILDGEMNDVEFMKNKVENYKVVLLTHPYNDSVVDIVKDVLERKNYHIDVIGNVEVI